jgi:hypothetical protein
VFEEGGGEMTYTRRNVWDLGSDWAEPILWYARGVQAMKQRALAEPQRADISPEVAEKLKSMRFEDFERLYHTGPAQPSGDGPTTRGVGVLGNAVSVGHVGIIELAANGVPYVIEAQPSTANAAGGIIRTRYTDWLKGYDNIQLWHGRVRARWHDPSSGTYSTTRSGCGMVILGTSRAAAWWIGARCSALCRRRQMLDAIPSLKLSECRNACSQPSQFFWAWKNRSNIRSCLAV